MTATWHIPGKLFLCGEYAVLEPGCPAGVLAVNRTLCARFADTGADAGAARIEIPQWGLSVVLDDDRDRVGDGDPDPADPRERFVRRLVAVASELAGTPWRGHLIAEPHERDLLGRDLGLGTSAALAVAVARGLLRNAPPDAGAVLDLALQAHGAVQGTRSSGADVAAAWAGCSICYTQRERSLPDVKPLQPPAQWPFVALFSGQSQRTGEAVRSYDSARQADADGWSGCIAAIRDASQRVISAVALGLPDLLPALDAAADAAQRLADWLHAPPPVPLDLRQAIRDAGAVIKSSGAIGGDCAVLIGCDADAATRAADLARAAGYEPLPDVQPLFPGLPAG